MIPYAQIDTIFLDHGNTLVSIDFDWVASELEARRVVCAPDALRRAEAAARPEYSQRLFVDGVSEGTDLFSAYLLAMFNKLDMTACLPVPDLETLVAELKIVLRPDGRSSVLWRSVMPRVPDALAKLRDLGVTLAVVSNSDGTVERSLETAGLRSYLSVVIDSALAGYEKPDPRIFGRALEACGAQPDRTLHVGDLYHADVAGARGAGLHAVLLDPFDDWAVTDCERVPDLWAVANLLEVARTTTH
ncbi:MAG: HAD-IA family hydrolase [Luteitalea sp.]|nr:HAD-IA family hydrolase [Luteitalea sp.]